MEKTGGLRRNTELFLLFVGAIPVFLLYAMYMITARSTLSVETMAVPIGLFAAFTVAHIAIRFLAPAADPAKSRSQPDYLAFYLCCCHDCGASDH